MVSPAVCSTRSRSFDGQKSVVVFSDLPEDPIYTLAMGILLSWFVRPHEATCDFDSILLSGRAQRERSRASSRTSTIFGSAQSPASSSSRFGQAAGGTTSVSKALATRARSPLRSTRPSTESP